MAFDMKTNFKKITKKSEKLENADDKIRIGATSKWMQAKKYGKIILSHNHYPRK